MELITNAINAIYGAIINDINFNILQKEITFSLTLVDDGVTTNHMLKILDCESFLWIEKPYNRDTYNFSEWDYYELTDISLCGINVTTEDRWLKQYPMEYNVAVEIWETALLIKATKIVIDEKEFLV